MSLTELLPKTQATYPGALMDSGTNGGMAGFDTRLLATVPHAHVDITGVGGDVLQRLPLVQCASVVDTIDKGPTILILSQYAHKPMPRPFTRNPKLSTLAGSYTTLRFCPADSKWL